MYQLAFHLTLREPGLASALGAMTSFLMASLESTKTRITNSYRGKTTGQSIPTTNFLAKHWTLGYDVDTLLALSKILFYSLMEKNPLIFK